MIFVWLESCAPSDVLEDEDPGPLFCDQDKKKTHIIYPVSKV